MKKNDAIRSMISKLKSDIKSHFNELDPAVCDRIRSNFEEIDKVMNFDDPDPVEADERFAGPLKMGETVFRIREDNAVVPTTIVAIVDGNETHEAAYHTIDVRQENEYEQHVCMRQDLFLTMRGALRCMYKKAIAEKEAELESIGKMINDLKERLNKII